MSEPERLGLVLAGGGARGAYQAGVLRAIAELVGERARFEVLSGVSVGAINAAYLAGRGGSLGEGAAGLSELWRGTHASDVYRTDARSLAGLAWRWVTARAMGGRRAGRAVSLLDTAPLARTIARHVDFGRIAERVARRELRGVAVSALDYGRGVNETFYAAVPEVEPWSRVRRIGRPVALGVEHVMASAAIPVVFPPVEIGGVHYGDGGVRNFAPLSAPIRLGATKLLVIALRSAEAVCPIQRLEPSLGRVASVVLSSVMLDGFDLDVERLERLNEGSGGGGVRKIEALVLRPSEPLAVIASEEERALPRGVRHLLRGLGRDSGELLSFLLFEPAFAERIEALGYRDTLAEEGRVRAFFGGAS